MDFLDLDAALPFYVDYLGAFEQGIDGIEDHADVVKELIERGVQEKLFLPGAELSFTRDHILIRSTPDRDVVDRYDLRRIFEPVAFIRKSSPMDGFSKVVIFKEERAGHFKGNHLYHALQCAEGNPEDLVELIQKLTLNLEENIPEDLEYIGGPVIMNRQISQASLDRNWFTQAPQISSRKLSDSMDSVRSATISRRSYGQPRASAIFGTEPSGIVPVVAPVPPKNRSGGTKPLPLVIDPAKTAETLGFEKPQFVYGTTESSKEKNSILLNYAIGDIEKFRENILAAKTGTSYNEFQATDFVEIFRKFKLAFNMLARLEGQIQNPTTIEILHHLFPPLDFLVNEAYERFEQDIVKEVFIPLLTVRAIEMLEQNLDPYEMDFWKGLGDYWSLPRSEWDGEVSPYTPRFSDGWTPGQVLFFHDDVLEFGKEEEHALKGVLKSPKASPFQDFGYQNDVRRNSLSSLSPSLVQDNFRDELVDRKSKIALVVYARASQNNRELSVAKGEYLEVLDSSKNWWCVVNFSGQTGFVPYTILKMFKLEDAAPDEVDAKVRDRKSSKKKENLKPRRMSTTSSDDSTIPPTKSQSPKTFYSAPAPPPPPPPPQQQPVYEKKRHEKKAVQNKDTVRSQTVHEELKSVLEIFNKREKQIEILKTPQVYITPTSSPKDVQRWLKEKQFSKRVHDELFGFDGKKLFSMTKQDLVAAFGKKEGTRLDSQITISRNMSGYTTGKSSELRRVLEKHRERIEKEKDPSQDSDENDSDENFDEESRRITQSRA